MSISQRERVLQYMKQGHSISQKEAIEMFGAYRLSSIIYRIREEGYNVITVPTKDKVGGIYATYKIYDPEYEWKCDQCGAFYELYDVEGHDDEEDDQMVTWHTCPCCGAKQIEHSEPIEREPEDNTEYEAERQALMSEWMRDQLTPMQMKGWWR